MGASRSSHQEPVLSIMSGSRLWKLRHYMSLNVLQVIFIRIGDAERVRDTGDDLMIELCWYNRKSV